MAYKKRWDYIKRNPGQLVTYTELQNIGKYPRSSVIDFFSDLFRGYTGVKRSGVINGFGCTPVLAGVRQLNISAGLGFYYNVILDATTESYFPVVLEAPVTVTLDLTADANPRYDLICLQPKESDADLASRSVRLSDGTLTTSNLYGERNVDAAAVIYTGTPNAVPVVPTGSLGDIPIAVVYVAGGAAGALAVSDIFDVRAYLNPRVGGVSEYVARFRVDNNNAVAEISEHLTDPTMRLSSAIAKSGQTGQYNFQVAWPRVFGTHGSELFAAAAPDASGYIQPHVISGGVSGIAGGSPANPWLANGTSLLDASDPVFYLLNCKLKFAKFDISGAGTAAWAFPSNLVCSCCVKMIRTD